VISLPALREESEDASDAVSEDLIGTVALAQALGDAGVRAPLWLVTRAAVSVAPTDPIGAPTQAQTWGLGMTFGLEHPQRWGGLVDLPEDLDDRVGSLLAGILVDSDGEDQLAIRGAGVFARRLVRAPGGEAPAGLWTAPRGTVLVTGGTGGLGRHVARWLARSGAEHLLLVSRRGSDDPGAAGLQAELEGLGAQVTIAACDVADREQLAELIDSLEDRQALRAVVHAAGAGHHCAFDSLTVSELEQALAAKVGGARCLDALTEDLDLSAFVLFSSIAGTVGSGSQAAYAAANAYLDALAARRHERGLAATSVAWGPWDGEGMVEQQQAGATLRKHGLDPMAPAAALEALEQALLLGEASVAVADIRWDTYAPVFASTHSRPLIEDLPEVKAALQGRGGSEETGGLAQRLRDAPAEERRQMLLEIVRSEVARVLGYASPEGVDPKRAFKELGFDSLMAVELRNRLDSATGLQLPATVVFDYPNPTVVAEYLLSEIAGAGDLGKASLEAGLNGLEVALGSLEDGAERRSAMARVRTFMAALEDGSLEQAPRDGRDRVTVGERVKTASDEEMFDFIDRELGSL